MNHRQENETGIHCPVPKCPLMRRLSEDNGTGTAVTLGTTFLDTFVSGKTPEVLENGGRWPKA